jgi:ferric iron reductase protein FhuF
MVEVDAAVGGRPTSWPDALRRELDLLGRWFEGRYVADPGPGDEVVPATRFLDPDYARAAIARAHTTSFHTTASDDGGPASPDEEDVNVRIAVSRFTRQYASSLSAIALVALARGVGLDLSAPRCRVLFHRDVPFRTTLDTENMVTLRCAERPTTWPVDGPIVDSVDELRRHTWQKLYGEHLAPLLEVVRDITRVSQALVWTNVAEWVGVLSDAADEYLGAEEARPILADRVAVLEADSLPGVPGPNPLHGRLDWVPYDAPDFPHGVQVRQHCCMTYLLPDRLGRLCGNCGFLPLEDRVALIRERHDVPMDAPQRGPALERAIELGLERVAEARRRPSPDATRRV